MLSKFKVPVLLSIVCVAPVGCGPSSPPIELNTAELLAAYISNAPAAEARFRGHPLVVTGISGGVDASNRLTMFPGVIANIRGDATSIGLGASVTVKCDSASVEQDQVRLAGCTIEDSHIITLEEAAAKTEAAYKESLARQ